MREMFEQVLDLQLQHSPLNTPEMTARGKLIRDAIPTEMRHWPAANASAALPFKGRLNVQGRDGTGLKTFVPWVRIHSPELSPSAQSGWYIVYLFRQDGKGVTLGISHGSTRFDGGDFKPRSASEAADLMRWGRGLIGPQATAFGMEVGVNLGSREKLSRAYESTTAFSKTYLREAIPDDNVLAQDASMAVSLLGELYRAQELGRAPDSIPPEIGQAKQALEQIARPRATPPSGGQGFGLSAPERAAVEKRAMDAALAWLSANDFVQIQDVHSNQSCDFVAFRDGIEHVIEVKGTTSELGKIILTPNEVDLHRRRHPHCVLIVVHSIILHEVRLEAMGGCVRVFDPFPINDVALAPLSYMCTLPV